MQNTQVSGENGLVKVRNSYLSRISFFWLIVGGLMLFFGLAAILHRAGIWSEIDVDNAGDVVLVLLGAAAVARALTYGRKDH